MADFVKWLRIAEHCLRLVISAMPTVTNWLGESALKETEHAQATL